MIREMNIHDWDRVQEIYKQGIESGISTFTTKCPSFEEWNDAHFRVCRFVYEADGQIAGWIALSPTSARDVYKGVAEISVYVDEQFKQRGIGCALIEHVKRTAPEFSFWSLFSVILSVNTASISLHGKCGFREIGYRERIAKDKFGTWQNTVLMEYRL